MAESRLGRGYRLVYEALCGRHPTPKLWHFQWLPAHFLNRDLREHLPEVGGRVLDLGCGDQPYRPLLKSAREYVGADVSSNAKVDVQLRPNEPLPFPDESFEAVLMTQVVEYVENLNAMAAEVERVVKPGGLLIVSFPFIFNEHGTNDYVRLSANAMPVLFRRCRVVTVNRQGRIGSTLGILFLNWLNQSLNRRRAIRLFRPLLLPLWLPLCLLVNVVALLVNKLDVTGSYYSNVFAVLRKVR